VNPVVDLRSDTVTRPTPGMRAAMAAAEVGDDALGDDPTVRRLEERVAALLGKEKGLFVPSGIMGNQLALGVLGAPGTEVLLEEESHIVQWEEGAPAALWGLQLRPIPGRNGCPDPDMVAHRARGDVTFQPRTSVLSLENTHLASGGRVVDVARMETVARQVRSVGGSVHLDGARLWNACAARGVEPTEWTGVADTVMVSLSKGLGAPVGAVLAGRGEHMRRAWRLRRLLGGQMRQAGILAAAGLYALDHHRERLVEDHDRARRLAAGLAGLTGVTVPMPETNIVMIHLERTPRGVGSLIAFLKEHGILMSVFSGSTLRGVLHLDVDDRGLARTIEVFSQALEAVPAA
jgi:threonine aldolase